MSAGVFMLKFAECLVEGRALGASFSQRDMPFFRAEIGYRLLRTLAAPAAVRV